MSSSEKDLLLGIDFGSGGCKATIIDCSGNLAGEAAVEYPTHYPHPGWSEQTPADWYDAMCRALAMIRAQGVDFNRIAAIAPDGSTHNAVLLDGNMQPVRDTIMWTDQRSTAECEELKSICGEKIFATAFQSATPTWTLPQLRWLSKHEPEVLQKTRHILFVKDYIRYLLTGVAVTDYIEAQGTLFFDMKHNCWSYELAALAGVTPEMLPELVTPETVTGTVTAQAARDTGIPAGTPVICGTSDSAAEDYGAGAIEPGDAIVKLATAGNVNVMTAAPHPHARTLTYSHVIKGMYYTVSATNAAAVCQRWFRDNFCGVESAAAAQSRSKTFALMDELAQQSPPGANGVFFHPYLQGERSPYWDSDLRGSFTGISMASTRGDFIRALLEGVAFSLRDCRTLIDELQLPMKRIFLIGGGARSVLWSEIVCNVMNVPVALPQPGDAGFGAALIAGTGAGIFPDAASAVRQCLKISGTVTPDAELAGFYAGKFETYRKIHDAMAPVYREIKQL